MNWLGFDGREPVQRAGASADWSAHRSFEESRNPEAIEAAATGGPVALQKCGARDVLGAQQIGLPAPIQDNPPRLISHEPCVCRAAILAAGSASILARRTLGRQGCHPNRQAGSLPYVPSQVHVA